MGIVRYRRLFLHLLVYVFSCKTWHNGFVSKKLKNGRETMTIDIPNNNPKIVQSVSPHGASFEIKYTDQTLIFYKIDSYLPSPNVVYYGSIGFYPLVGKMIADTIIEGKCNGKCWKETFRDGYSLGYQNVHLSRRSLFDKSLATFTVK